MKVNLLENIEENENTRLFLSDSADQRINQNTLYNILIDSGEQIKVDKKTKKSSFNSDKLISVIIPTYNRKEMLAKCVNTILNQTHKNVEIFIIDDGSTDGTEQMVKEKFKNNKLIKYVKSEKNVGEPSPHRKSGYDMSRGEFIIFCDDDDYYIDEEFFEKAIKIMTDDMDIVMVSGNVYKKYIKENKYVSSKLNISGEMKCYDYLEKFCCSYSKPYSTFTSIFRKSNFDENNFGDIICVNDTAIYLRALISDKKIFILDDVIGIYGITGLNITFNLKTSFFINTLKDKLKIKTYIEANIPSIDPEFWFKEQIVESLKYYIYNNYKKRDVFLILKWEKKNLRKHKYRTMIVLYAVLFKCRIRGYWG